LEERGASEARELREASQLELPARREAWMQVRWPLREVLPRTAHLWDSQGAAFLPDRWP